MAKTIIHPTCFFVIVSLFVVLFKYLNTNLIVTQQLVYSSNYYLTKILSNKFVLIHSDKTKQTNMNCLVYIFVNNKKVLSNLVPKKWMKKFKFLLVGIVSFVLISAGSKIGEPPAKVYRVGNSMVSKWENDGKTGKWSNFQIQKEYIQNGAKKWSNYFTREELIELKAAIEQALDDKESK